MTTHTATTPANRISIVVTVRVLIATAVIISRTRIAVAVAVAVAIVINAVRKIEYLYRLRGWPHCTPS